MDNNYNTQLDCNQKAPTSDYSTTIFCVLVLTPLTSWII